MSAHSFTPTAIRVRSIAKATSGKGSDDVIFQQTVSFTSNHQFQTCVHSLINSIQDIKHSQTAQAAAVTIQREVNPTRAGKHGHLQDHAAAAATVAAAVNASTNAVLQAGFAASSFDTASVDAIQAATAARVGEFVDARVGAHLVNIEEHVLGCVTTRRVRRAALQQANESDAFNNRNSAKHEKSARLPAKSISATTPHLDTPACVLEDGLAVGALSQTRVLANVLQQRDVVGVCGGFERSGDQLGLFFVELRLIDLALLGVERCVDFR